MPTSAGVGKQAQQIQGVFGPTVSIQNLGPGNVYLGSDSSVTPDNGWRLPENAMGTWTGGSQLWACSDGATASLRIADSSLAFFTPGPDHVTIDGGTVTIGNASIPITGSVDIASGTVDAVINGPVAISGGNVNVGGTVTALGAADALYATSANISVPGYNLAPKVLYDSTGTNLSKYATLSMQIGGTLIAVDPSWEFRVSVEQYTTTGQLVKIERPSFLGSGFMRYQTQIVAPVVKVTILGVSGLTTGFTLSGGVSIVGMTASVPHMYYQNPGSTGRALFLTGASEASLALSGYTSISATVPASTPAYWYPETFAGPASYSWRIAANAGTTSIAMLMQPAASSVSGDFFTSTPIILTGAAGSARAETGILTLPEVPIALGIQNNEATARPVAAAFAFQR